MADAAAANLQWTMRTGLEGAAFRTMGAVVRASPTAGTIPTLLASDGQRLVFLPLMQGGVLSRLYGRFRRFEIPLTSIRAVYRVSPADETGAVFGGVGLTLARPGGVDVQLYFSVSTAQQVAALSAGPLGRFFVAS